MRLICSLSKKLHIVSGDIFMGIILTIEEICFFLFVRGYLQLKECANGIYRFMIYNISEVSFPFTELTLHKPTLPSHNLLKMALKREVSIPVFVQLPECQITRIKKNHCDLVFSNEQMHLLDWVEQMEERAKQMILANSAWFETDFEEGDIEQFMLPILKWVRINKHYIWKGVGLSTSVTVYDDKAVVRTIDEVKEGSKIISILEIRGIRFTPKSFQLEAEIKQIMITQAMSLFDNCLIQPQTRAPEPPSTKLEPSKLEPTKLEPTQLEPSKLEPTQLEPSKPPEPKVEQFNLENLQDEQLLSEKMDDVITINKRMDILNESYKRAKEIKRVAFLAYLEAKKIKNTELLNLDEDSDSEEEELI